MSSKFPEVQTQTKLEINQPLPPVNELAQPKEVQKHIEEQNELSDSLNYESAEEVNTDDVQMYRMQFRNPDILEKKDRKRNFRM